MKNIKKGLRETVHMQNNKRKDANRLYLLQFAPTHLRKISYNTSI